jgi:hypothetical protein
MRDVLGPGAEHGPALVVRAVGVAIQREEVVPVEGHVDAHVLAASDGVADVTVARGVLRLELDTDADWEAHGGHVIHRPRCADNSTVRAAQSAGVRRSGTSAEPGFYRFGG